MKTHELWLTPPKPAVVWAGCDYYKRLVRLHNWRIEPKIDGWRCIIVHGDSGIQCFTRQGKPLAANVPGTVELPPDTVLDCEWTRKDGNIYVFDVPILRGIRMSVQYLDRRARLKEFIPSMGVMRVIEQIQGRHSALKDALDRGYEGIVFKEERSMYPTGKTTKDWIKCKG